MRIHNKTDVSTKKNAALLSIVLGLLFFTGCYKDPAPSDHKEHVSNAATTTTTTITTTWPSFDDAQASTYIRTCQQQYQLAYQQFQQLEGPSAENLLSQLDDLQRIIDGELGKASLFANVHPNETLCNAAEQCDQRFVTLISDINLSKTIYEKLASLNTERLTDVDKRYVKGWLRDFRRSGVNLDGKNQDMIKQLTDEINQLGQQFYKNVNNDVRKLELAYDEKKFSGMPQDFIDAHLDRDTHTITLTTNYPDYYPIMQYADDDALRKEMYGLFRNRGYPANEPVLKDILKKRYQLAKILGYKHYADYATEVQMVKSAEKAQHFIDTITQIARPQSQKEYELLLTERKKDFPNATAVADWQKTYLEERLKKTKFQLDSQQLREYFQYNKVKQGVFDLTKQLFNVDIIPWEKEVWHEDVEAYQILDNGNVIGQFYLDMHPRDGKYKHAAAFTIQDGILNKQLPIKALVCNFPKNDSLMEHGQVETFLHEFGHLLHGIFGGHQKWVAQSGIKTERDFVEAPSQMLEEWIWNAKTLSSFASNQQGETIPTALIEKLRASRDFGFALFTRHQMFYAALSLNYYTQDPETFDIHSTMQTLQNQYSNFAFVEGTHFQYSFGHLYGYSAAYYTYMWSLVIADDMFSEFDKHGMLNKDIADRYRRKVLEPGGSKDAADLVADFLKRPYAFDAFSKRFH